MKAGLTGHELWPGKFTVRVRKRTKIRAFRLGTAILHELHRMVADGAIRESQSHVSTHHMWQPPSGDDRGETRLALTHRAAGFLL
jgi:hypothetical protein